MLGIGPNATGPGPSIPTQALPGSYGQGVLINESVTNPDLQFGPPPSGLQQLAVLNGSPITNLNVTVGSTPYTNVPSIVDTGGVQGTIPSGLNPVPGETISVYAPNGALLYKYTYDGSYFPTVISSGLMNTGALPYLEHPAYINYGADTTTFYS